MRNTTTTAAKKTDQLNIRGSDADLGAFRRLCETSGFEVSDIVRDLMRAALCYIPTYCSNGRWYPPRLVPDTPASAADFPVGAATPITVRNGNGHCNVRINKRIQR